MCSVSGLLVEPLQSSNSSTRVQFQAYYGLLMEPLQSRIITCIIKGVLTYFSFRYVTYVESTMGVINHYEKLNMVRSISSVPSPEEVIIPARLSAIMQL